MAKKVNSKFYVDCKMKDFSFDELDKPKTLWANGIYRTKLTEADLPDSFVKWTYWTNRYNDMAGVKDIVYKVSIIGDNTLKYDHIFISYDKPIQFDEDGYAVENTFDFIFTGNWYKDVLDKVEKYNPELKDKVNSIRKIVESRIEGIEKVRKEMFNND